MTRQRGVRGRLGLAEIAAGEPAEIAGCALPSARDVLQSPQRGCRSGAGNEQYYREGGRLLLPHLM